MSYTNISGTFYYLCSILDGCSRYVVTWDVRESMTGADIEIILERARKLHPDARNSALKAAIRAVVLGGKLMPRAALDAMLTEAEASAAK